MYTVFLCQRSNRTDFHALAAIDTSRSRQIHILLRVHIAFSRLLIAFHLIDSDFLYFLAHSHTASAGNTLVHIPDHCRARIVDSPSRYIAFLGIDSEQV